MNDSLRSNKKKKEGVKVKVELWGQEEIKDIEKKEMQRKWERTVHVVVRGRFEEEMEPEEGGFFIYFGKEEEESGEGA